MHKLLASSTALALFFSAAIAGESATGGVGVGPKPVPVYTYDGPIVVGKPGTTPIDSRTPVLYSSVGTPTPGRAATSERAGARILVRQKPNGTQGGTGFVSNYLRSLDQ